MNPSVAKMTLVWAAMWLMAIGLLLPTGTNAQTKPEKSKEAHTILAGKPAGAGKATRLFILSGQSNMARLNPFVSLIPTLEKAFPDDELILVKRGASGQSIRRWYKGWVERPARPNEEEFGGTIGDVYDEMMAMVNEAVADKTLASVSFIWMQGESDGIEVNGGRHDLYKEALTGLIKQLRDDLKRPDMTVVIGRINANRLKMKAQGKRWAAIREAQVAVAEADPLAAWVDCDPFGEGLHYSPEGYAEMGKHFAEKTIALLNNEK